MKAILEFSLPEEMTEHQTAIDGHKWCLVVEGTLRDLRSQIKYQDLPDDVRAALEGVRSDIFDRIDDEGLRLE